MTVLGFRKLLLFLLAMLFINLGATGKLGSMLAVFIDAGQLRETA